MSVDRELRQAIADSEAVVRSSSEADGAPVERSPQWKLVTRLAGGGLVLLVGSLFIDFVTQRSGPPLHLKLGELLEQRATHLGRTVRVRGELVPGTLKVAHEQCQTRFTLSDGGARLAVHYGFCVVPDTLRDRPGFRPEITAEGKLESDGHFEATILMAKTGGPYEMKQRAASSGSPLQTLEQRP